MRDDLHRTVPLARPWRQVLKYACREADWDQVPEALSRAIRCEVEGGLGRKWAKSIQNALNSDRDMFDFEHSIRVLSRFEQNHPTPMQRRFCEVARGLSARDGNDDYLYERTVVEVCRQTARSNIEHVAAQVRINTNPWQATQVRERLCKFLGQCTFDTQKTWRVKRGDILDMLNFKIALSV